jgi:hypothetical protein
MSINAAMLLAGVLLLLPVPISVAVRSGFPCWSVPVGRHAGGCRLVCVGLGVMFVHTPPRALTPLETRRLSPRQLGIARLP